MKKSNQPILQSDDVEGYNNRNASDELARSESVLGGPSVWEIRRSETVIIACITACNESHEELKFCLDTFLGNCPQDVGVSAVYVFLDACPDEHMQPGNKTFQALVELMKLQVNLTDGLDNSHVEGGCRVYHGMLGNIKSRLYVKGRGDFQRSKRRSVTAFYSILAARIASGTSAEPFAVLHMDADTGSCEKERDNAKTSYGLEHIARMARIMEKSPHLGVLASQVRAIKRSKNWLTLMQSFDLNATYVGVFGAPSLVGRSIACFGMSVLYRYRALHESRVKGVPSPLTAFSRSAGRKLGDLVNLDMNEDQGMTTFMLRAGHDTKISTTTRFFTFSPETLTELLGQRRRWQAGYFVGIPSQLFGMPSPHLTFSKLRILFAAVSLTLWLNILMLPGTLAAGLGIFFGEVYEAHVLDDNRAQKGNGERDTSWLMPRGTFASAIWIFWLLFIVTTIDKAPKKIRTRCSFFVSIQITASVAICLLAASVSRAVLDFLILVVGVNMVAGLALTHDVREWPHRLQELPFYIVFLFMIQPLVTIYSVSNIDSALWGTRSVGTVNATAKTAKRDISVSETMITSTASTNDSEPPQNSGVVEYDDIERDASEALEMVERAAQAQPEPPSEHHPGIASSVVDTPKKVAIRRGVAEIDVGGGPTLREKKFTVLLAWILLNMGITALVIVKRLYILNMIYLLSNNAGLAIIIVAARVEASLQLRAARSALAKPSKRSQASVVSAEG